MTLAQHFYQLCLDRPDAEFIRHEAKVLSRAEVLDRVRCAVFQFSRELKGDDWLLASSNRDPVQRVVQMLAASWLGYRWLLTDTQSALETTECFDVDTLPKTHIEADGQIRQPAEWPTNRAHWTLYSSGTTGAPKDINLQWSQIEASAEGARERLGVDKTDRWLCILSLGHIAGASIVARACLIGHQIVFGGKFCAEKFHSLVVETGATVTSLVPTMLSRILERRENVPGRLRIVMLGGGACPEALRTRASHWPLWITWGMSETASHIATSPLDEFIRSGLRPIAEHRLFETRDGHVGIEGPVAPGGRWVSADLGHVTKEGFVTIEGRSDDVVKVAGNRVNLSKIRQAFVRVLSRATHIEVFAVPDRMLGTQIVAALHGVNLETVSLSGEAFASLESWELPHWLMAVDEMPLTPRYKVDRLELSREWAKRITEPTTAAARMQVLPERVSTCATIDSSIKADNQGRATL